MVLNLGSDVLLWMSDGKLFHRIIERGKKLVSVDDFFTAGTGYRFFRKFQMQVIQIRSGQVISSFNDAFFLAGNDEKTFTAWKHKCQ